jgi:CPA1 family monovalent cation:H+ antiporter
VVGLLLGWIVARVIARIDDYLIETTLTTLLAFGAYLMAERLHFSGVLAVVAAGLVNGNLGPRGMSPTTRIVLSNFWEYIAFLPNSLVFLLIGMQIDLPRLGAAWQNILGAILAVLVARLIIVYGLGWLANRLTTEPIPLKWKHVLNWSGLRGAISLALALSLPSSLANDRETLQVMAFGVVLFTLLIQSTTMRSFVHRLKIVTRSEAQIEYEISHARLTSLRIADNRLDRLYAEGSLSAHSWERLKQFATQQAEVMMRSVRGLVEADPALEAEDLEEGWRELFRSQRSALLSLRQDGVIAEDVYEKLTAEVDAQLIEGSPSLGDGSQARTQFLDVTIPDESQSAGKTIADRGLPRAAVLVSIRRGNTVYIPHGDTQLLPGDVVTVLCEREYLDDIRKLLVSPIILDQ